MSATLLNRIKHFLKTFEPLQDATLALFERKRTAVTSADTTEMLRLAETEAQLARQLQESLGTRREILLEAKKAGLPSASLADLAASIAEDGREALTVRIQTARRKSEQIRRESWVQWVISQRASTYYNELLELIAYSGKRAPVYGDRHSAHAGGGTILDASA